MMLPLFECPGFVRRHCDGFKDIVGIHYRDWVGIIAGTINGIGSLSDISRFIFFGRSVSSLSRFLNAGLASKINRRHRRMVRSWMVRVTNRPEDFLFVIDDTLLPHAGPKQWGVYNWYDHTYKTFRTGNKLLVIGLMCRKRRLVIPLHWQILHVESDAPELYRKANQVVLDLLQVLSAEGFPKLTVVGDSWYAGEPLYQGLSDLGYDFVFEIRRNRIVATIDGRKPKEKIKIEPVLSQRPCSRIRFRGRFRYAFERCVRFRNSKVELKAVGVKNKLIDEQMYAIYVTNRLAWNASKVWSISRDRWMIEVHFRELKSLFALGEPAVRSKNGIETTISVSLISLTVIRLEQFAQPNTKKDQHCRPDTAGNIVQKVQLRLLQRGISKLAHPSSAENALLKLRTRLTLQNLRRKPTEKLSSLETPTLRNSRRKTAC
jgi:hypothetical protein